VIDIDGQVEGRDLRPQTRQQSPVGPRPGKREAKARAQDVEDGLDYLAQARHPARDLQKVPRVAPLDVIRLGQDASPIVLAPMLLPRLPGKAQIGQVRGAAGRADALPGGQGARGPVGPTRPPRL
jgi:hypothetical protein